jgi:hypothetical protein
LRYRQQDVEVAQLNPATNPVVPSHRSALAKLLTKCRIIELFNYMERAQRATEVMYACHRRQRRQT